MISTQTLYLARVVRTAFAVCSSLLLAMWLGFTNPYWAPTTVLVVESLSRFEMLDKTYWRLLGSLLGSSVGIGIVGLCAGSPVAMIGACAISTCVGIFFLQRWNPSFWRWVLFSLLIVVLYTINEPDNAFLMGVYRVSGVGLGVLVVLLSHMVVPAKDSVTELAEAHTNITFLFLTLIDQAVFVCKNGSAREPLPLSTFIAHLSLFKQACKLRALRSLRKRDYCALGNDMEFLGRGLIALNNPIVLEPRDSCVVIERLKLLRQQILCIQTCPCSFQNTKVVQGEANDSCFWEQTVVELEEAVNRVGAFMAERAEYLPKNKEIDSRSYTEVDLLGGNTFRLYRAAVCGLGVVISMLLWRFAGWPAGQSFVFITMVTLLYTIVPPHLSMKFLVILFAIASSISGIICIFILPQISDVATFMYVLFLFYCVLSLLIQSNNPKFRVVASLIAILTNSTANGYAITTHAFIVYSYIALSLIGAVVLSWLILKIFIPFSPKDIVEIHHKKLLMELRWISNQSENISYEVERRIIARINAIAGWSTKLASTPDLSCFLLDAFCLQSILMNSANSHDIVSGFQARDNLLRRLLQSTSIVR